jgi:hypothetical protein
MYYLNLLGVVGTVGQMNYIYIVKGCLQYKIRSHISKNLSTSKTYFSFLDRFSKHKLLSKRKFKIHAEAQLIADVLILEKRIKEKFDYKDSFEKKLEGSLKVDKQSSRPKKILLLMPESLPGAYPVPNPLLYGLAQAGREIGASLEIMHIDKMFYDHESPLFEAQTKLKAKILTSKFDLIFVDMSTWQRTESFLHLNVVNPKFIYDLRVSTSTVICGVLIDLYSTSDEQMLQIWEEGLDCLLHSEPLKLGKMDLNITGRAIFLPYTGYGLYKKDFPKAKGKTLSFSGALDSADRQRWLNFVVQICNQLGIISKLNVFTREFAKYSLPQEDYLTNLMLGGAVLNLCQKTADHYVLTARTFESVAAGNTLIHEESKDQSALALLYEPFLHYVPFETPYELEVILHLYKINPKILQRVATAASEFHSNNYTANRLFSEIINVGKK